MVHDRPHPPQDPDVAQETWRIYYGDVVVGSIAACVGSAAPMWQWRCGFYPGSRAWYRSIATGLYQAGRSKHWVKVKNRKHLAFERVKENF